jgi:hypothetical protein
VGNAIANNLQQEPYWKRFFDGYKPAQEWLQKHKPDIAIVVYNDHGLNFFLDKVPTFALGCADTYENADEGWALKPVSPFTGDAQFSWHIAEKLVEQEFDICTCQEMKVDHGFVNPIRALYGTHDVWPIKAIPLAVNVVQHPVPTAARCLKLGRALRKAVGRLRFSLDQSVVLEAVDDTGQVARRDQQEPAELDKGKALLRRPRQLSENIELRQGQVPALNRPPHLAHHQIPAPGEAQMHLQRKPRSRRGSWSLSDLLGSPGSAHAHS